MNYFILTMQYNENLLLPVFIDHYSRFVDKKHIKILDHGSSVDLSDVTKDCDVIHIPRDRPFSEDSRLRVIPNIAAALLEYYDFGIFVDCDELIDLTDIDNVKFDHRKIHYAAGFEVFFRDTDQGTRLHGLISLGMCKPSIFARVPRWTVGFHRCEEPAGILPLPMAHIRFLYKDRAVARMQERFNVHQNMREIERNGGVNIHWSQGLDNLNSFYRDIENKAIPEVRKFEPLYIDWATTFDNL